MKAIYLLANIHAGVEEMPAHQLEATDVPMTNKDWLECLPLLKDGVEVITKVTSKKFLDSVKSEYHIAYLK